MRLTLSLLFCLFSTTTWAWFDPEATDAWLKQTYPADEPGVTIIAMKDGEVVFRGAYGMANMELDIPLETDMVMRLGSITKQFTATAIMMLEQEGKLSVSDDISKYLPGYNTHGHTITIEHLLTHTSGIPNHTDQEGFFENVRNETNRQEMFDSWQDLPLDFEPGERYNYSNSGYWMLGVIIEEVSGVSYEDFVAERIFKPLGMRGSFHDRQERIIPRRASGYELHDDEYVNAPLIDMSIPGAAGALASNVEDMALWDASLYTDQLLPAEARQRMWTPYTLNSGELSMYGYGWALAEHDGSPVISHNGGIPGFQTSGYRMPDQKLYVLVLGNGPKARSGQMSQRLVLALLGEETNFEPIEMDVAELEEYVGVYRISDNETRLVTIQRDLLYTRRGNGRPFPTLPLGDDRFLYPDTNNVLIFHRDEDGAITHQEIQGFGIAANRAELTDEPVPEARKMVEIDPAVLEDYAGDYELMPGFVLSVWAEDGHMMTQATGQGAIDLAPGGGDMFFNEAIGAVITFNRNEEGTVQNLTLEQGGQTIESKDRH